MYKILSDPDKRKWVIAVTMFIAIICNYLDRQILSILKPEVLAHFDIGNYEYAWIVNVFLICYAVMYPISGLLVDRFGPKKVLFAGIVVWSLACIGGGLAPNAWFFGACRGILGIAEPTVFSGQLVAVTLWFEKRQRATANSLCCIGGSYGAVIAPLMIAWLMRLLGYWQYVFIISGVIGLIIAVIWLIVYKTPSDDILQKTVYADDAKANDNADGSKGQKFTYGQLAKKKTFWGGILIRLLTDPVWYFCCFWLPGFLRTMGEKENLGMQQTLDMIQWLGGVPFLVGATGGMLGSMWSDRLIKKGMPSLKARKKLLYNVIVIAPLCMFVPYVSTTDFLSFDMKVGLVVTIFSMVAFLCLTWLYTVPVVLTETFPVRNVGQVMGTCCGAGALGSVVFNQFVGSIPEEAWTYLFIFMGCLHLVGAIVVWKMVKKEY